MRAADLLRLTIAALATIGGLLVLVPRPYWSVMLVAIQAAALAGKVVVLLNQRRRP